MAEITLSEYNSRIEAATNKKSFKKVGWFRAPKVETGDVALVRFAYADKNEFYLQTVHTLQDTEGKWKTYSCLRETPFDDLTKCPLCASGQKSFTKFFVKLWVYTPGPDGKLTSSAVTWSRPASFANALVSAVESAIESGVYPEGSRICDVMFKLRASRQSMGKGITYSLTPIKKDLYEEATCPNNFDDFSDLDFARHDFKVLTAEELTDMLYPVVENKELPFDVDPEVPFETKPQEDTKEESNVELNAQTTTRRYF